MMRESKTGISEHKTGLQVGLQQDDTPHQELLAELISKANAIPIESASVVPLPIPRFIYTSTNQLPKPDDLNGLIINYRDEEREKDQKNLKVTMAENYPWVPLIESEQLNLSSPRENFIVCVSALHELNQLRTQKLTRHILIDFHSRYKLVLLAHSQPGYREIGPFVAKLHQWQDLDAFFIAYRRKLMAILQQPASCENHVNVMMHIQGYFSRHLTATQKNELCCTIHEYRVGKQSLRSPLAQLKKYLSEYPNDYLLTQKYFILYPNDLSK